MLSDPDKIRWDQLLQDWGDRNPKDNEICQQIGKLMAQQARDSIDQTLEQHNVVALLHPTESMMADLAGEPSMGFFWRFHSLTIGRYSRIPCHLR